MAGVPWLATETDRIAFFFKSVPFCFYAIFAVLGTFLLSWAIGVAAVTHALATAILTVLMLLAMIASNGMWAGKNNVAIAIECGYIAAISTIMIVAQGVLRDVL